MSGMVLREQKPDSYNHRSIKLAIGAVANGQFMSIEEAKPHTDKAFFMKHTRPYHHHRCTHHPSGLAP